MVCRFKYDYTIDNSVVSLQRRKYDLYKIINKQPLAIGYPLSCYPNLFSPLSFVHVHYYKLFQT